MALKKASKRILKPESAGQEIDPEFDPEFDKDIEEAKTLRDVERLEKKDSQLWFLTVYAILVLILFNLVRGLENLSLSWPEFVNNLTSLRLSVLVLPISILLLAFCAYILSQKRKVRELRREIFIHKIRMEHMVGNVAEVMALYQISSGVTNHKDLSGILEMIARESLTCLKAHRSTVFLLEEKGGILKTQFTYAFDPSYEQVGLFEEKEVARKVLRQRKPSLLRTPADFSEFFKYGERDRKITSLISVPLASQGKGLGVFSVVIIDEERKFAEKDLQLLMIFANQANLAMESSYLLEEVRKGSSFRKNYEQYLDNILNQLQSLSDVERKRIEDHIGKLMPAQPTEGTASFAEDTEEVVKGTNFAEQPTTDRAGDDRIARMLQVDTEGEPPLMSHDLGEGGVFIRTPNPLDLGEEFLLKLHLAQGEEPIEVTCKVIWTNKYGKESRHLRRGMGVKFLNLSPELQNRVEGYIQSHKNKQFSFAEDERHLSLQE